MIATALILFGMLVDVVVAVDLVRRRTDRAPVARGRRRYGDRHRGLLVIAIAVMTIGVPVLVIDGPSRALGGAWTAASGLGVLEWTIVVGMLAVAAAVCVFRLSARPPEPAAGTPAAPPATGPDWMRYAVVAVLLGIVGGTTAVVAGRTSSTLLTAYWLAGAGVVAACLTAFLVGRRFTHLPVAPGRVLCIVPVYNEPASSLALTVRSLVAQTVPIDIVVIDDGSETPVQPTMYHERLYWWRQPNTGKRGAQVAVLRQIERGAYDFILTVDSDSQPHPDACQHLLRAMSDPKVQAATGMLYVRNYRASMISMASDLDIGSSCVMMRASRSMLGALETTSGALAMYRAELLYDHLDAYAVECGTGDDRWLALRALTRGEVVAVAEARVETDMPETLRGTYRQRLRWARSWWWMLPYVFRNLTPRQMLSPLFGLVQLVISPVMFAFVVATMAGYALPATGGDADRLLVLYVTAYMALRYGLSALYLMGRPGVSRRHKVMLLLAGTPLSILLNLGLLTPTRYVALARLFDNRWQTRQVDPNQHGLATAMEGAAT